MKEGEGVDEGLEGGVGAVLEGGGGDLEVGVAEVQFQAVGRLGHHLQGSLEWEMVARGIVPYWLLLLQEEFPHVEVEVKGDHIMQSSGSNTMKGGHALLQSWTPCRKAFPTVINAYALEEGTSHCHACGKTRHMPECRN